MNVFTGILDGDFFQLGPESEPVFFFAILGPDWPGRGIPAQGLTTVGRKKKKSGCPQLVPPDFRRSKLRNRT